MQWTYYTLADEYAATAVGLVLSFVTKESKGAYIQALIDSRELEDSTIIQDVMLSKHIVNLEQRILQYQNSINDTVIDIVNDTVEPHDTISRLIAAIREHPAYTYERYARLLGISRATVARCIKQLNGTLIRRIGSDKTSFWEFIK